MKKIRNFTNLFKNFQIRWKCRKKTWKNNKINFSLGWKVEKLENKWKSRQCFQFKKQGLMQLQVDDYSFLCSAPALPLPQWELQLANCLNFWPGKFGTTLAELSWREPLWIFWSPLFHTGLKWSPNWLSFFCPPSLLSQVPGACLRRLE